MNKSIIARPWLLPDRAARHFLDRLSCFLSLYGIYDRLNLWWLHPFMYLSRVDTWQRYTSVVEKLKSYTDSQISVLDVGGGEGRVRNCSIINYAF